MLSKFCHSTTLFVCLYLHSALLLRLFQTLSYCADPEPIWEIPVPATLGCATTSTPTFPAS